jgi:hypothetical protein
MAVVPFGGGLVIGRVIQLWTMTEVGSGGCVGFDSGMALFVGVFGVEMSPQTAPRHVPRAVRRPESTLTGGMVWLVGVLAIEMYISHA